MPPPPPGMDGAPPLGSGFSVTTASVVSSRPVMELAFCSAVRVILVGVDHAGGNQVLVLVGARVGAEVPPRDRVRPCDPYSAAGSGEGP